jgi:hypothetical protein
MCQLQAAHLPYASDTDGSSSEDALVICNRSHLAQLAARPDDWTKYVRLADDIDLAGGDVDLIATMDQPFTGNFDGGGFTLRNLRIDAPTENQVGLFRWLGDGARLENVRLEDVNIVGREFVGALVGHTQGDIVIANASVTGILAAEGSVGGLVGGVDCYPNICDEAHLSDLTAEIDVTATGTAFELTLAAGGLVGYTYEGSAEVFITRGRTSGVVRSSYAAGGIAGAALGITLEDSSSSAAIVGGSNSGGLVGVTAYHDSLIVRSFATGDVDCAQSTCGGLVGYHEGDFLLSYATGNVTCRGGGLCGGLVGSVNDSIVMCFATGNVTATEDLVGGLAGEAGEPVRDSFATGNVVGRNFVGGLVGEQYFEGIERSYATGSVTGLDAVGGLVGGVRTDAGGPWLITTSFSTGIVRGTSATDDVTPLLGADRSTQYMSTGNFAAAGRCTNTLGNCRVDATEIDVAAEPSYFFTPTSPVFATWDFATVWVGDGTSYPRLRGAP